MHKSNNQLKLPTPDEVRDELIVAFCNPTCPSSIDDSHCPDHDCIVWKLLQTTTQYICEGMNKCTK